MALTMYPYLYLISIHLMVEYGGPWRTLHPELDPRSHLWRAALFLTLAPVPFLPWFSTRIVFLLLGLTILRETTRWILARCHGWIRSHQLAGATLEIVVHLVLLCVWIWVFLAGHLGDPERFKALAELLRRPIVWQSTVLLAALTFTIGGGTVFIRSLLAQTGNAPDPEEYGVGRLIGDLERTLIFLMAIEGQYDAIGLVIAAKSVARFKEFDDRDFAEYYLLGTLSSTLWAIFVARIALWIVGWN